MPKETKARIKINKLLEDAGWRFLMMKMARPNLNKAVLGGLIDLIGNIALGGEAAKSQRPPRKGQSATSKATGTSCRGFLGAHE